MKFIQLNIIYVIICTASVSFGSATTDSQVGIISFVVPSNDILQQDPTLYNYCFDLYISMINDIANAYEKNFKECLEMSLLAAAKADENTFDERYRFINAANAMCNLLKKCAHHGSVEEIFQCYAEGGYQNIQTMYDLHVNASIKLADLREAYFLLRTEEYKCTNETKRKYEKESAGSYGNFNDCILGHSGTLIEQNSTTIAYNGTNYQTGNTTKYTTTAATTTTTTKSPNAKNSSVESTTTSLIYFENTFEKDAAKEQFNESTVKTN